MKNGEADSNPKITLENNAPPNASTDLDTKKVLF